MRARKKNYIYYKKIKINKYNILYLSIWIAYTCITYLSGMQKIYLYIVDILLLLGCFITSRLKLFTLDFEVFFYFDINLCDLLYVFSIYVS